MASQGDHVPLLNASGDAHEEQIDHRFALDEETAEAQGMQQQSNESSTAAIAEYPKYPPSAPPPSYRQATGKSHIAVICSRVFSIDAIPDFTPLRRYFSGMWIFLCKFWPTSRFAQVGFFMIGLWLLVIISGPAFEEAGPRAGAGYPWAGLQELANSGPGPISGDGHVIAATNWTLRSCRSSDAHHGQVLCTSTTTIELDIPKSESFSTNEALFIFADPPRQDHLADSRGKVPGTIEFKIVEEGNEPDQAPAGKVHVIIDAQFEQNKIEIFEKSTIVKMASRSFSQGVGIYTHPLPSRYQHLDTAPLTLFVTILIPAGSSIPTFRTEASAMNIGVFTPPDALRESKAVSRRGNMKNLAVPTFGRFAVRTGSSTIRMGYDVVLESGGSVHFASSNGNIILSGKVHSQAVKCTTLTGSIIVEENSQITASREAQLETETGIIDLKKGSWILSGELLGKATTGGIPGGEESGVWKTNKTLQLHTTNGPVRASVEVIKTTDLFYNQVDVVYVVADSKNGAVDVRYVAHEKNTALHSTVSTSIGTATAHMHRNFEGMWNMEGSKGSKIVAPSSSDKRHFESFGKKEGTINVKEKGEIWFRKEDKHREEAKSSVSSSIGVAQLIFD